MLAVRRYVLAERDTAGFWRHLWRFELVERKAPIVFDMNRSNTLEIDWLTDQSILSKQAARLVLNPRHTLFQRVFDAAD